MCGAPLLPAVRRKTSPTEHIPFQGLPSDPTGHLMKRGISRKLSPPHWAKSTLLQHLLPPTTSAEAECPQPPKVPCRSHREACHVFFKQTRGWAKGQALCFKVHCSQARQGNGAERAGWSAPSGSMGGQQRLFAKCRQSGDPPQLPDSSFYARTLVSWG